MVFKNIFPYLKKRFVRLYPIYVLCIALTLLLIDSKYPLSEIIANFTFLQVMTSPVFDQIAPIWSLHYEVVYYILLIGIALLNFEPLSLIVLAIFLGVLNYFIFPNLAIISSLCFGFCFWASGLAIARYLNTKKETTEVNFNKLLSSFCLLVAMNGYNVFATLFHYGLVLIFKNNFDYLSSNYLFVRVIPFIDLSFLPYCILFVLTFSGLKFRHEKWVSLILQLLAILTFKAILFSKADRNLNVYIMPSIFYIISLILFFLPKNRMEKLSKIVIEKSAFLGSMSFATYIVHHPIMVMISRVNMFSGSIITYLLRVSLMFALTLIVAYVLELKYQPWVRQFFIKPKTSRHLDNSNII